MNRTQISQEALEKANRVMERVFYWGVTVALASVVVWILRGVLV